MEPHATNDPQKLDDILAGYAEYYTTMGRLVEVEGLYKALTDEQFAHLRPLATDTGRLEVHLKTLRTMLIQAGEKCGIKVRLPDGEAIV